MFTRAIFNFRTHFRLISTTESKGVGLAGINGKSGTVLRSGALAIKKGMMSYWDSWGKRHPATILHVRGLLM